MGCPDETSEESSPVGRGAVTYAAASAPADREEQRGTNTRRSARRTAQHRGIRERQRRYPAATSCGNGDRSERDEHRQRDPPGCRHQAAASVRSRATFARSATGSCSGPASDQASRRASRASSMSPASTRRRASTSSAARRSASPPPASARSTRASAASRGRCAGSSETAGALRRGQRRQASHPPTRQHDRGRGADQEPPEELGPAAHPQGRQVLRIGLRDQRRRAHAHVAPHAGRQAGRHLDGRPLERERHDVPLARRVAHETERQLDDTLGLARHAGSVDALDVVAEAQHGRSPEVEPLRLDRSEAAERTKGRRRHDAGRVDPAPSRRRARAPRRARSPKV